jgi:3alpha(or 20beta)-hydroxysteroid dehydrogenase
VSIEGVISHQVLSADFGDDVLPVATDVSKAEDVAAMIAEGIEHFGKIDVLVNNAGITGPVVRTHELTEEGFAKVIVVNLMSQFYTIKYVIPHFLGQGVAASSTWPHSAPTRHSPQPLTTARPKPP